MSHQVEYKRLRTIEDVRRERLRIRMEIERTHIRLERDYDLIGELFSVDFWSELFMSKISVATARLKAEWFSMGYNLISNLLKRFTSKPRSCGEDWYDEDAELERIDRDKLVIIREYEDE